MKQTFSFYKEGRINKKIKQTSLVTLSNQFINKCTEISNILKELQERRVTKLLAKLSEWN